MSVKNEAKEGMSSAIEHFNKELKGLRTGRANPAILDDVRIEAYGSQMRIKELANVTVAEARQLVVSPFDPQLTATISKGIERANLGLMPAVDGNIVRIPVPPLNEETRKEIVKQAKNKAEEAKVSVRESRRRGNELVKKMKSGGEMTEDEQKRAEKDIQELTDKFCKDIDVILQEKEKDILSV